MAKNSINILYVVIIILIVVVVYLFYQNNQLNLFQQPPAEEFIPMPSTPMPRDQGVVIGGIERTPQQVNALDRVYNPLRYPYKGREFYNQNWRPNLALPPQVIGCGARNTPCLGGTQVPIANPMYPININNDNIAPINIRTRGPLGEPQQVGSLYKLYSHDNEVLPLFGRRRYPRFNDNWEYYTLGGYHDVKMKVITKRRGEELGTNDIVFVKGYNKSPYRVTMYETDFPQYIPYL